MFQTLVNVQRGEAVSLQQYIDNRGGCLRVGLKSITFTVGWYNVEAGQTFSWRSSSASSTGTDATNNKAIPPGLYGFKQLKGVIEGAGGSSAMLTVNKVNGLITLTVANGQEVLLTNGLLLMLGLDDGLDGVWLDAGTYIADRPINFATRKVLRVHLEEINTTDNVVDGTPSTVLACIGIGCHSYGDVHTVRAEHPEYKRLLNGSVGELKVTVRDDTGRVIDNHDLPIYLTLEVL